MGMSGVVWEFEKVNDDLVDERGIGEGGPPGEMRDSPIDWLHHIQTHQQYTIWRST